MPTEYRQRTVDAPASEWLNSKEASAYLGLSDDEFLSRVRAQTMPAGSDVNTRKALWSWQCIQGVSWNRAFHDALHAAKKDEVSEEKRKTKMG